MFANFGMTVRLKSLKEFLFNYSTQNEFTNGEEANVGVTKGRAVPRRGRATSPRRDLFQGQELGCPHGQGRPPDHWPEPSIVRSSRQGPDRHSEGVMGRDPAAKAARNGS